MKKYVLVLILLLAVAFTAGCAESDKSKDTNISSVETSSSGQTDLEQPSQIEYQDKEWANNAVIHTTILTKDFNNGSSATKTMDIYSLSESATFLQSHTETAIKDCDSYTVSPELQPGKDEYRAGLVDANNAATFLTLATGYLNDGDTVSASQALEIASNNMVSCGDHFINASVVVDEYNKNHGLATETLSDDRENLQQPAQTETANQVIYEDSLWLDYIKTNSVDLSGTLNGISTSINNGDVSSLQGNSEVLMLSTDLAIKENDNYNISPKYQEANKEWVAGLQDYNAGGKILRKVAIDAQDGILSKEDMNEAAELCASGTKHMQNAADLIKVAS